MHEPPLLIHVATVPNSLLRLFRGQFDYVKAHGIDVAGVSSGGKHVPSIEREQRIKVYVVPMKRAISPISDVMAIARMYRLFRTLRPALVHSHTPKAGLVGSLAAMLARVPTRFYSIRGLRFLTMTGWRRAAVMNAERLACACSHRVLSDSLSNMEIVVGAGLCKEPKIKVLGSGSGNGVDTQRFRQKDQLNNLGNAVCSNLGIPPSAAVVGFVGRLARDKGIKELAEAWDLIHSRFPEAHLLIVGRLDRDDPVPARVLKKLEMDKWVHIVGDQLDVVPFYAAMDVFTLPTYREGFPNVILEAGAMELPTVAFTVSGCIDAVVSGETGLLVGPPDSAALAESICELLGNDELRLRLGKKARQRILQNFEAQKVWARLVEEYQSFLPVADHPHQGENHS